VTVADLTERELIARVVGRLPAPPEWVVVGIGDDAAVVEPARNQLDVFTVDASVEGVHFDRRLSPPDAIGHRALAVNLSDLAATGAAPRVALLSLALPADLPTDDLDGIVDGLTTLARRSGIQIVGGNITRSSGPIVIDVTAVGSVKRRSILRRSGARAGDAVYLTGTIGGARAGLQCLQDLGTTTLDLSSCIERYRFPQARMRVGHLLGRNRAASACMDLSDGLADGLRQVSEASGVGMTIEMEALPIETAARAWFERAGVDPVTEALAGGDDYELLFTVRPSHRGRLRAVELHGGVPLTRIGVCTPEPGVRLSRGGVVSPMDETLPREFRHFR
jgi:thiamine-monophosphate kinase